MTVKANLFFLQSGPQTQINTLVQKTANNISGKNAIQKVQNILIYLQQYHFTKFDEKLFRKRTAIEIIDQKLITGCTDAAIVFIALARANGIPTKYVETMDREWLRSGEKSVKGHQYAEIFDQNKNIWIWVDPMGNRINTPHPNKEGRVIFNIGLDSWDIGIHNFKELEKNFKTFRIKWIIRQKIHQLISFLDLKQH